jgi:hypothetical protein
MKTPAVIKTNKSITAVFNGKSLTVRVDNSSFDDAVQAYKNRDWQSLHDIMDTANAISRYSVGKVKVLDGVVLYNGKPVANVLVQRILEFVRDGLPFEPLVKFLDNVMANPSLTAQEELYLFLEAGQLPITEDGCFLAYRKVDDNYMSYHANPDGTKNRNKVGDVPTMKREDVDTNRHNTCSRGLHFCAHSYLGSYHGGQGRVMIVKINPADVVSIPSDYGNAKGRTWRYEVVAEYGDKEAKDNLRGSKLATVSNGNVGPVRDSRGRFAKKS